jgi:hypothetical protein
MENPIKPDYVFESALPYIVNQVYWSKTMDIIALKGKDIIEVIV